jgi:hypothetical protein
MILMCLSLSICTQQQMMFKFQFNGEMVEVQLMMLLKQLQLFEAYHSESNDADAALGYVSAADLAQSTHLSNIWF